MLAGLCAFGAFLIDAAWLYATRLPPLTDDQVQQLVDEYWVCEFLGDTVRSGELFRDLDREGITLYATDDGAKWERR
jgi:hypothetical protein